MRKVTISSKGQISLPADLRCRYDLKKGDRLIIRETKEGITLEPVSGHPLVRMQGHFKPTEGKKLTDELINDREKERKNDRKRAVKP